MTKIKKSQKETIEQRLAKNESVIKTCTPERLEHIIKTVENTLLDIEEEFLDAYLEALELVGMSPDEASEEVNSPSFYYEIGGIDTGYRGLLTFLYRLEESNKSAMKVA